MYRIAGYFFFLARINGTVAGIEYPVSHPHLTVELTPRFDNHATIMAIDACMVVAGFHVHAN